MADTDGGKVYRQTAPWPAPLDWLVAHLELTTRPRWQVYLADLDRGQGSAGLTLCVLIETIDAYHPEVTNRRVMHYFPVPPAAFDVRSWRRWLFDRLADIDRHELCESFVIDGEHVYAPSHGPGNDPYLVRELGTGTDQRTSYRGELDES